MIMKQEIVNALEAPLDERRIASRKEGWGNVSYLETWDVIAKANEIFGFDGWDYLIDPPKVVWEGTVQRNKKNKEGEWEKQPCHEVHYTASVLLKVHGCERNDVGYGSGMSYTNAGEAHELGIKEAVSDALKRAFRTWGEQFGNTLYDKHRKPRQEAPEAPQQAPEATNVEQKGKTAPKYRKHAKNETRCREKVAEVVKATGTKVNVSDAATLTAIVGSLLKEEVIVAECAGAKLSTPSPAMAANAAEWHVLGVNLQYVDNLKAVAEKAAMNLIKVEAKGDA